MSTTSISLVDAQELIFQLANLNLGYLTISVAVITLLTGFIYLFNLKPVIDSANENKKDLLRMKVEGDELNKVVGEMAVKVEEGLAAQERATNERLAEETEKSREEIRSMEKKASERIKSLEKDLIHLKLEFLWEAHYIWDPLKVEKNIFSSLLHCLEESIEHNVPMYYSLCLSEILRCFEKKGLKAVDLDSKEKERLLTALSKVNGLSIEKQKIESELAKV